LLSRLSQHPLLRLFLGVLWLITVVVVIQGPLVLLAGSNDLLNAFGAALTALTALLAYLAFVRVVERRWPVAELALRPAAIELFVGVALGAGLFIAAIGLIALFADYTILGRNPVAILLPALALSLISGVVEELIFRGLVFRVAQESLGTWLALLLSGLIFGLLHLANPNATLLAGLAIALEAGLLLGAAYVFTGRLWVPIGLHFAWNFTQGGIFGVAVSGNEVSGLLETTLSGPAALTGGAFGAEASIFAVLVCTLATLLLLWQAHRRRRIVPAPRRRRPGQTLTS
jgi:membrane protease YdiL (CAAX protease family)